jgi:hypothetical protein
LNAKMNEIDDKIKALRESRLWCWICWIEEIDSK